MKRGMICGRRLRQRRQRSLTDNGILLRSLYVTLELVKLIQCMYAAADRQMYDAHSDTPFVYKTTTLNEVSFLVCSCILGRHGDEILLLQPANLPWRC